LPVIVERLSGLGDANLGALSARGFFPAVTAARPQETPAAASAILAA
jgi:hypothetical protein